ncbi:MAG: polymer-forming cytoskeletal protein [SAR324 cluster bacterium]|nr:polymer-forming cytoskeletal protein [SAR324 cluster bacterium]
MSLWKNRTNPVRIENGSSLPFKILLTVSIVSLVAFSAAPSYAKTPKSWQISSPYILQDDVVTRDITCNNATLTIQAEVTGQIFAVGCQLVIGESSLLHQGIIFSGGHLLVEENAEIFGDITQIGGSLKIVPGANLHGIIRRFQKSVDPPKLFLDISQHYLTFQRIVPNNLEHLMRVAQELRLHQIIEKGRKPLKSFIIPNFLDFLFQKEQIRFAQKWLYEKNSYPIELQIMEFSSPEKAFQFWTNILTFTNLSLEHSVQNGLGDGGHWFFRFQNRSTLIWHRRGWVFSAQVYAPTDPNDVVHWNDAENELDGMIRIFQQALRSNTNKLDQGDRYIGDFSVSARR